MFNVTASGVNAVNTWGGVWAALDGEMDIAESAGSGWAEETSHLLGGVDVLPGAPDTCLASVVAHSRSAAVWMSRAKPSMTACVITGDRSRRKPCRNVDGHEDCHCRACVEHSHMTRTIPIRAMAELQYAS